MRRRHCNPLQLPAREPTTFAIFAGKHTQRDPPSRDCVPQCQQPPTRFPRRQLPQAGQQSRCRSLSQQHRPVPSHEQHILRHRLESLRFLWQHMPAADAIQWAAFAFRICRLAHQRTELHQCLIEVAAVLRRQQCFRDVPSTSSKHAREHPRHVAVHNRRAFAERDARDRPRRVPADAGKLNPFRRRGRARPPGAPRCPVQVLRTRVVAQTFPQLQHA